MPNQFNPDPQNVNVFPINNKPYDPNIPLVLVDIKATQTIQQPFPFNPAQADVKDSLFLLNARTDPFGTSLGLALNLFPVLSPFERLPYVPYEAAQNIAETQAKKQLISHQKERPSFTDDLKININNTGEKTDIEANKPYGFQKSKPVTAHLGVPVVSWIQFRDNRNTGRKLLLTPSTKKQYTWRHPTTTTQNTELNESLIYPDLFIAECLITVNQKPRITKTSTVGKNGTIKTYIGQDDYEITIDGFIFNLSNKAGVSTADKEGIYPQGRMMALQSIIANQDITLGIEVYSPYLELFGIVAESGYATIVVTGADFPQIESGYSQQKFTIQAISDYYEDLDVIYSPYSI